MLLLSLSCIPDSKDQSPDAGPIKDPITLEISLGHAHSPDSMFICSQIGNCEKQAKQFWTLDEYIWR